MDQDNEFWEPKNFPLPIRTLSFNKLAKEVNKGLYKEIAQFDAGLYPGQAILYISMFLEI